MENCTFYIFLCIKIGENMKNIAIFASGTGTNAENIIRYFSKNETIRVSVVLSNNQKVEVHTRVNKLGVPSFVFSREEFQEGKAVLKKLIEYNIDLIVLAGFMTKISAPLLEAFPNKIINIHPALLPKFGGKGMYGIHVHEAVVAAGEKETGITIHYVNSYYDEGEILFQAQCPVFSTDTPEDVAIKVHSLEYKYYPVVIEKLLQ